ncbi:hypothetical protein ACIGT4_18155 [Streptomyces sioyaensis]|uniref:hypothetical protein n=1 Tax=Streptomyces sioyaensis TaxID=67364 RepID=UPI0037D51ECC
MRHRFIGELRAVRPGATAWFRCTGRALVPEREGTTGTLTARVAGPSGPADRTDGQWVRRVPGTFS